MIDYTPVELTDLEKKTIEKGLFIQTVKAVRERTNSSLYDAKKSCDAYRDSLPKDYKKLYEEAVERYNEKEDHCAKVENENYNLTNDLRQAGYSRDEARAESAELRAKLIYATALLEKVLKV